MYVGHLAIGVAIKSKFPQVSTLAIMLGVGFLDIIDVILIMLGINHVSPNLQSGPYLFFDLKFIDWDHSLLMAILLSIFWGALFLKNKTTAIVAGLACFSHWLADWPLHNMDLALFPYSIAHFGYGLWGKLGTGSWILEGIFSAIVLAYAWQQFKKQNISIFWPVVFLTISFFNLSPWFSPMKKAAQLAEPYASLLHGFFVFIGFFIPALLITWLINRQKKSFQ